MVSIPAGADGASDAKPKNSLAPGADGALTAARSKSDFNFFYSGMRNVNYMTIFCLKICY